MPVRLIGMVAVVALASTAFLAAPATAVTPVVATGVVHLAPGWGSASCFEYAVEFHVDVDTGTGSLKMVWPKFGLPCLVTAEYAAGACVGTSIGDITCYRTVTETVCNTTGHGNKAQTTCTTRTYLWPELFLGADGRFTYLGALEGQLVRA